MINLLDGLRDLKAPLSSGLAVLFGLWLIFADEISKVSEGDSLSGNVWMISNYLTPAGSLAALAFLAYILGTVLSLHVPVLYVANNVHDWIEYSPWYHGSVATYDRLLRFVHSEINLALQNGVTIRQIYDVLTHAGTWNHSQLAENDFGSEKYSPKQLLSKNIEYTVGGATAAIRLSEALLATQLHSAKDKVYERYDKCKTESTFRAALVIPILFVGSVVATRLSLEGNTPASALSAVTALATAAVLSLKAVYRQKEASDIIVHAILNGDVKIGGLVDLRNIYDPQSAATAPPDPGSPQDKEEPSPTT